MKGISLSISFACYLYLTFITSSIADANIGSIWQEDFQTNNFSKWSYLLHPQGISILPKALSSDDLAAYIEITGEDDYLWQGIDALNRVELQHKPFQTKEGETSEVNWQFMVPKLFGDDTHQIAYWESDKSYRQSYSLQLNGSKMSLISKITNEVLWSMEGVKPQKWYSIKIITKWSLGEGNIALFIDDEAQIDIIIQTLISHNENMFIQLGILRKKSETIESIWIDNVSVKHF